MVHRSLCWLLLLLLMGCSPGARPETAEMKAALEFGKDVAPQGASGPAPVPAGITVFSGEPELSSTEIRLSVFVKNAGSTPATLVFSRSPTHPRWNILSLRLSGPGVEELQGPQGPEVYDAFGKPMIFEQITVPAGSVVRFRGVIPLAWYRFRARKSTVQWELRLAPDPLSGQLPVEMPPVPLQDAAGQGWLEDVKKALDAGTNINAETRLGVTAIQEAASNDQVEVIEFLLKRGAKPGHALHTAASRNKVAAMQALLRGGAPIDALDDNEQRTALHWAAGNGYADAVRLLLSSGASVNIRTKWGTTPLDAAMSAQVSPEAKAATVALLRQAGGVTTR